MTLLVYKMIAALLVFIVSITAIIYPLRHKTLLKHPESVELGEAFASGIFLGAAFFHMLPEAIHTFAQLYPGKIYPIPEMVCVGGFLLLIFLERLSLTKSMNQAKHTIPYIFALILIIHAITEGAALGMAASLPQTLLLFIAILAHKASESFALCITLLRHAIPFSRVVVLSCLFSVMTPAGIGIGASLLSHIVAPDGALISALFNAFAAGTFFYISTLHHIRFHQHTEEKQGLQEFACLALGLTMMGIVALWM